MLELGEEMSVADIAGDKRRNGKHLAENRLPAPNRVHNQPAPVDVVPSRRLDRIERLTAEIVAADEALQGIRRWH
jgi:hypothetical protein